MEKYVLLELDLRVHIKENLDLCRNRILRVCDLSVNPCKMKDIHKGEKNKHKHAKVF